MESQTPVSNPNPDHMVVDHNSVVITVAVQAPGGRSIFIVPREVFLMNSESQRLREVFNKPQLMINDAQGRCIGTHPHILPGITEDEFDAILSVLLHGPSITLNIPQWVAVKSLAVLWKMPSVLALAISRIGDFLEARHREHELEAIREHASRLEAWQTQQRIVEERQAENRKLQEAEDEARRARQWLSDFPTLAEANRK